VTRLYTSCDIGKTKRYPNDCYSHFLVTKNRIIYILQRTLESIPPWWASAKEALYDEMGNPAIHEERLRRISPLFHADQITKPLMVVQGANDPRVLQVESDEIVAALRNNSVPVEYLVFEDEGHGFQVKSNRIEASEAYLALVYSVFLLWSPRLQLTLVWEMRRRQQQRQ
jgi:acetyl esterase/lipase